MSPEEFWLLLWGRDSDLHEVELPGTRCWIPCPQKRALIRLLHAPGCAVSLVPRTQPDALSWGESHLLWCHLRTAEAEQQLERFRPAPTVVLREGETQQRWALWSLSRPLSGSWVQRGNDRINHWLRGLRRDGNPETLIPSPFGEGWAVEFEWPAVYTPREIVGRLREAPDPNGWKQQRDAASTATT